MFLPADPAVLVSVVNTKLRDLYDSLSDLCDSEDIDEDELCRKLASAGFLYDKEQNRFR